MPQYTAFVTMLVVLFYFFIATRVPLARRKFNVPLPAITGHPDFERVFRVHQNTLEWLPIFLPSLWLCALYLSDAGAAALGVVWILGRALYYVGYSGAVEKRLPGILHSVVGLLVAGGRGALRDRPQLHLAAGALDARGPPSEASPAADAWPPRRPRVYTRRPAAKKAAEGSGGSHDIVRNARLIVLLAAVAPILSFAASNADLFAAAQRGDRVAVSKLLDAGAEPNARAVDGTTPLHWAVRGDNLETAALLLESGADAVAQDRYGVTPLYLAAENGSAGLIAKLLDAGADANAVAPIGETALMTATRTGLTPAIALLLDRGAAVDARDPEFEQTALMLAVRESHPDAVQLLIERGADVNARTRVGETPKFVPPCKGTGCGSEGVGINRGGLPDRGRRAAVAGGMTPLLYAARDGRVDEARLLVAAGADLELAEANGIRPLLMALLNNQLEIARLLLAHGADTNADDFWGRTPLFAAVEYRNLDMNNRDEDTPTTNYVDREPILAMIEELIAHGANVNAQTREVPPSRRWLYSLGDVSWVDFTGQTPFLRAALSGDVATMRLLLAHGADPNVPTQAGTTPLMAAAGVNWVVAQTYTESRESLLEAIDICFEHGADVNAANSMGLTALLGAANRGSNEIIRVLAERGARLDVKDKEGRDALRWAEGVFLASVGAERKPATIALLNELMAEERNGEDADAAH